nr:type IV-A pilus assembly ATPase PilB [Legionella lansingensis]
MLKYQKEARSTKQTLPQYLIKNKLISSQKLAWLLSLHFGIDFLDLDSVNNDLIPWKLIDEKIMRQYHLAPLFVRGNQLFLAIDDPSNQIALKEVQFHTGFYPMPVVVESDKLMHFIEKLAQIRLKQGPTNDHPTLQLQSPDIEDVYDANLEASRDDGPIVKFVNAILSGAIHRKASDIHFEPYEDRYRIRYRQDGILVEVASPSIHLASRVAARVKIMSNLDISERRLPQDGRFKMKFSEKEAIDFRVSICPIVNGEKVVIRILDPNTPKIPIEELGLNATQQELFLQAIGKPQGMVLVTGPTGSGKTVSLYAAINLLNTQDKNILTAEDPVEIKIPGVNQVHINPKAGLTFATTLRSFLRQDPDIIMIGEIRDAETAEMAINAAQTGHLVLSTLHTNSAVESLTRLNNMGIPSFNIASSVSLLIAQRLARRLCNDCKVERKDLSSHDLFMLGFDKESAVNIKLYQRCGCKHCIDGYSGRIGLFEVVPISKTIGDLILAGQGTVDIMKQAQNEGMITLYESGIEKIKAGLTTIEEVNRVTTN